MRTTASEVILRILVWGSTNFTEVNDEVYDLVSFFDLDERFVATIEMPSLTFKWVMSCPKGM